MNTRPVRLARGFSLLEAIVAMTLIAIAGFAIFAWINASFESINRSEAASKRAAATMNAVEYLKTLNPAERPTGRDRLGDLEIEWNAKVISPPTRNHYDTGVPAVFMVSLYEVEVIFRSPTLPAERFVVQQVGWVRDSVVEEEPDGGSVPSRPRGPAKK